MARTAADTGSLRFEFIDNLDGGARRVFLYHMPTTAERTAYSNATIQRRGKKIKFTRAEAQLAYGMRILDGFEEGLLNDKDGKPISSDPKSANYAENWRELVKKYCTDLVCLMAAYIFDGSAEIIEEEEPDEEPGFDDAQGNSQETSPQ